MGHRRLKSGGSGKLRPFQRRRKAQRPPFWPPPPSRLCRRCCCRGLCGFRPCRACRACRACRPCRPCRPCPRRLRHGAGRLGAAGCTPLAHSRGASGVRLRLRLRGRLAVLKSATGRSRASRSSLPDVLAAVASRRRWRRSSSTGSLARMPALGDAVKDFSRLTFREAAGAAATAGQSTRP